jgi:hypothetical protein
VVMLVSCTTEGLQEVNSDAQYGNSPHSPRPERDRLD